MAATIERRKLTPPEIAAQYGVDVVKVHGWIKSGELKAINGAARADGKPRFLIDVDDLADFESRRQIQPPPPATRRRKRAASINEGEFY